MTPITSGASIALRRLAHAALCVALMAVTFAAFQRLQTLRLAFSGFLGMVNVCIVVFLLILTGRHFLLLFFASREWLRNASLPDDGKRPGISILVPAYNEGVVIERTIAGLLLLEYPTFEIIVIDDGSSDDTLSRARSSATDPRVRVYSKQNGGKARALNFGIEKARYPLIFCMDADSLVAPRALLHGVKHLADPGVVAVAGSVLVLNQRRLIGRFQALEYLSGLNLFKNAQSYVGMVTVIPGPSGLFRRDVVQRLGGYHHDTFAEDCDLTLRIVMNGGRVVYEPLMEVRTEVPSDVNSLIKQRYRWNRGILQATRKHLGALPRPWRNPGAALLIVYLGLESVLLPFLNIFVAILSLIYTFAYQDMYVLSLWLLQLTLLDLTAVAYTLSDPRWPMSLAFVGLVNRFSYAFFLDVVKVLSSIEEFFGIQMVWGKLERTGDA